MTLPPPKQLHTFFQNQNRMLTDNQKELDVSRSRLMKVYLMMVIFIGTVQGVLSFFVEANFARRPYYFVVAGCTAVLFVLLCRFGHPRRIYYVSFGLVTVYVALTNAFISVNSPSVLIICVLFVFPLFIPDKSWRIVLFQLCMAGFYLFLVVPHKPVQLVADEISNVVLAIASSLCIGEVVRAIQLENFDLKRQAYLRERTDPLTGLPNRRQLFEAIPAVEAASSREAVGVLVLDIDYFKSYNDTYGHREGDVCLKTVGECFSRFTAKTGVNMYRFGGEEFVGILRGCDRDTMERMSEALRKAVYELEIPHANGVEKYVTVSIGFTFASKDSTDSYERLFSQADTALYAAKNQGRNRVRQYSPTMQALDTQTKRVAVRTHDRII